MAGSPVDREVPLRIVFAGTPAPAVPSLRALIDATDHEIVGVVTRPDARVGRGRNRQPSPVAVAAQDAGLQVIRAASARTPEFLDALVALAPDLGVVVAYGAILPLTVLEVPARGWVNLHFSLLPAWRGAAPVAAAIRNGDAVTGASTFRLETGLDTGPVYGTVTEPVGRRDTTGALLERLAVSGAGLLRATVDGIAADRLVPVSQPTTGVSHFGKVGVPDARVDWTQPAVDVDRLVRSVTPDPGAWTESRWGVLGLGPVEPVASSELIDRQLPPGAVVAGKREVLVGTASSPVRLSTVTAPGKKVVPAADWARGARLQGAEWFGRPAAEPQAAVPPAVPDGQPVAAPDITTNGSAR